MITRDIQNAAEQSYDLIIIGGGIYGIALLYQATSLGLHSILVEQGDFANATSTNSLRIVHGGFRYLQKLDLHRFYESVGERRWFLKTFGGLVQPLACLMPLYNRGLHRSWILRPGLMVNDLLSWNRNQGVPANNRLPNGRIVTADMVRRSFQIVENKGLAAGAVWYDGTIDTPQRALMEWLKAAVIKGAQALNHVQADGLLHENDRVRGIRVVDQVSGQAFELRSDRVVNAAGPWCREVAARFDRDQEKFFRSSIAWNVLFDHPPLSDHALAITPPVPNASTYFLRPWKGRLLAGTVHEPYSGPIRSNPLPEAASLADYIAKLNLSIPGLNLDQEKVLHVFSGLLPAKSVGSDRLAVREIIHDHGRQDGPQGLYTVSGVKFTTARLVAEKTLQTICKHQANLLCTDKSKAAFDFEVDSNIGNFSSGWENSTERPKVMAQLREIIRAESVVHLDDLMLRRTTLGDDPRQALELAELICECFDWDDEQQIAEIAQLKQAYPYLTSENTVN